MVCGRDTALGAGRTFQVIHYGPCDTAIFAAVTFVTTPRLMERFQPATYAESCTLSPLPHSTATQLFQHRRIDVAAADDGDIQIRFRKLVAAEQEAAYGHGSAGLGHGLGV